MQGELDEAFLVARDPWTADQGREGRIEALAVCLVAGGAVGLPVVNLAAGAVGAGRRTC